MIANIIKKIISPVSRQEDDARREFILNVLLATSIGLVFLSLAINLSKEVLRWDQVSYENNNISAGIIFLILLFILFLFFLSKKKFFRVSAFLLIFVFYFLAGYMSYEWGVDVNASLLFYVLVIAMSGVLISSFFAFFVAIVIALTIATVDYLQKAGLVQASRYWRGEKWSVEDTVMMITILIIAATVSWLSNREIERSLKRARRSEADLKRERDMLEVKVEERTRELKTAQMERISQMYRLAEFGRLSSGAFHDMMNLLTALSLNVEQAQNNQQVKNLDSAKTYLNQATLATKRIHVFITAIRKQIAGQKSSADFSLNEEIEQAIEVLSHKSKANNVELVFTAAQNIITNGDQVKFNQVITNLISNAIDSYISAPRNSQKVEVSLDLKEGEILLMIKDWGQGIPEVIREKIFEPFFTTKEFSKGTGIGLSLAKDIIEKDFGGTIELESNEDEYTKFTIKFLKK